MGLAVAHCPQFTKLSLVCEVLYYSGKCLETPVPVNLVLTPVMPPAKETTPQRFIVISTGVVHELWAFVLSKKPPMTCGVTVATS